MKYITFPELILSIILIILGFLLLNPLSMSMSHTLHMTVYGLLLIFTGIFTGLVVHGKPRDEREALHYDRAGRFGYTLGVVTLLVGITYQTVYMPYDPWLLITLIAMILGKVLSRIYNRMYR